MRTLLFLASVALACCVVTASPIDPNRWLVNRPTEEPPHGLRLRPRRSPQHVKGGEAPIKGRVQLTRTQPTLRKGEYICGTRICRLRPGDVQAGCDGACQHLVPLLKK